VKLCASIRLNAVFQTEQLPAGITDLDTGLTDMDAQSFTHFVLLVSVLMKTKET
jgi:hypothetical protein